MPRLLVAFLLVAAAASAQDARLVLREAAFADGRAAQGVPDTTGWERATVGDAPLRLGRVLLALDAGTVTSVEASTDPQTGAPLIALEFADASAVAFAEVTSAQTGRPLAIVLDGRVLTAPTVTARIDGGRLQITGAFSQREVDAIVAAIRNTAGPTAGD